MFICFCLFIYLITYLSYYCTGVPYPGIFYMLFVTFIIYIIIIITIIIIIIIIIINIIVIMITFILYKEIGFFEAIFTILNCK